MDQQKQHSEVFKMKYKKHVWVMELTLTIIVIHLAFHHNYNGIKKTYLLTSQMAKLVDYPAKNTKQKLEKTQWAVQYTQET